MDITSDRIISDCVDINNDILQIRNSSRIKFIGNIKANHYRKKFIKIINKLPKANQPLSKNNIYELVTYIYNSSITNEASFGCISNIKEIYLEGIPTYMYCIIKVNNNILAKLRINILDDKFNIDVYHKDEAGNTHSYTNIELKSMQYNDIKEASSCISEINKALISNMSEFIVSDILS